MPFNRFVQTGRVALVSNGPKKGSLVSIVDVIDQTRVLIDGPCTEVPRQQIRLNQLHLTKHRISFPFSARTRVVRKAWTDAKISEKWAESMWAKKLANKEKHRAMNDFDRFKLRKNRSRCNKIRTVVFKRMKKAAHRDGTLYGIKKKVVPKKPRKPRPEKKEGADKKKAKKQVKAKPAAAPAAAAEPKK